MIKYLQKVVIITCILILFTGCTNRLHDNDIIEGGGSHSNLRSSNNSTAVNSDVNNSDNNNNTTLQDGTVSDVYYTYEELGEIDPPNVIEAEINIYDEEGIFEKATLIAKGIISNKKELAFSEYKGNKLGHVYIHTYSDFLVNEIYYQEDSKVCVGDTIRLSGEDATNDFLEGSIVLQNGREYIFLLDIVRNNETIKFTDHADYFIVHPWQGVVEVINGLYEFDDIFDSLKDGATKKIRQPQKPYLEFPQTKYVKDSKFESELRELIQNKQK